MDRGIDFTVTYHRFKECFLFSYKESDGKPRYEYIREEDLADKLIQINERKLDEEDIINNTINDNKSTCSF